MTSAPSGPQAPSPTPGRRATVAPKAFLPHTLVGWLLTLTVLTVLAWNSLYVVGQNAQAVVQRFGRPVAVINPVGRNDAGLWLKLPFVDRAVLFDKRNQPVEVDQVEVATAGSSRLTLDAALRFRIVDPLRFYRALGDPEAADGRLQQLLTSSLGDALGTASPQDVVSGDRDALMQRARVILANAARASRLGVQVLDVRLLSVTPSPSGLQATYRRMQAAREQQAAQVRDAGDQRKREVMAEADRSAAVIRGTANGQAEQIRGDAEAKRAAIFTQAYGRDPEFAGFLRTMQTYRDTLGQGDTTVVLSPDSTFLRGMEGAAAGSAPATASAGAPATHAPAVRAQASNSPAR